ncbi:MAG: HAMP domain-containing histidine kinase [Ruminococcaceae bacterium]|nr:HAMP domain-containing histidine kinase [Oscillospiraceae bacterium]
MKSTFSRLFTTLVLILLAAMILIGITFGWLLNRYLTQQTISSLKNDAQVIAQLITASHSDQNLSDQDFYVALTVAVSVSGADAVICDANGTLLLCGSAPMGCEHVGLKLDQQYRDRVFSEDGCVDTGMIKGLYTERRYVIAQPVYDSRSGRPLAIVMVSAPIDVAITMMSQTSEAFLAVAILVIVLSVVLLLVFLRRQSKPLRQMAAAARAFGHGNFGARVQTDKHHTEELQELALAFNNMASSLEKGENQRQEFVANVSHELKTPMTTIAGYVDGILDGTIPPEKGRQYLTLVSSETKRLNRLVRSMLDISRLQEQGGFPEESKTRFDLSEIAGQVLISFEQKINDKRLDVQVVLPDHPVFTRANQDAITQVIYNLVDNAVKFCPEGGQLGITVREGNGKLYLSVSNSGETIPPEELSLLFERFHKLDKSRSRNRDSWGLGLYIVKTLIDSHEENISVTSINGLTTFTFTLPLVL